MKLRRRLSNSITISTNIKISKSVLTKNYSRVITPNPLNFRRKSSEINNRRILLSNLFKGILSPFPKMHCEFFKEYNKSSMKIRPNINYNKKKLQMKANNIIERKQVHNKLNMKKLPLKLYLNKLRVL